MISMIAILGLIIHLLGLINSKMLVKIMMNKPSGYLRLFRYITPQRSYDISTIIGALICCSINFQELLSEILKYKSIFSFLFSGLLGTLLPLVIWKIKNRRVIYNGKQSINIDAMFFLPFTAVAEEVIWRFFLPSLLLSFWDSIFAIFLSSIGFVLFHIPFGGMKSIFYMSLFTILAASLYLFFGILSSIIFHIFHNLTIQFFSPLRKNKFNKKTPTLSQTDW